MQDLTLAKRRLRTADLTLAVAKTGNIIFETRSNGLIGLLKAIEALDKKLMASAVADKVVGRAAALLCAYSEVASVFAVTLSEEGAKALDKNNIVYEWENRVKNILNYEKKDVCPFEKLAINFTNPRQAYEKIKNVVNEGVKSKAKMGARMTKKN